MSRSGRRFGVFVLSLLATVATADAAVTLKVAITPQMSWTFDQSQESQSNNKATAFGQTQPFSTSTQSRRSGTVQVLTVENGEPTSIRVTFDDNCVTINRFGDQPPQRTPYPFGGKTVTVTRGPSGRISDDLAGQFEPGATDEIHNMLEMEGALFPDKPIEIGDEWDADNKKLARVLQLKGQDRAGMRLKLLDVKDVDGRKSAELKVSMAVDSFQQGLTARLVSQGTAIVDMATGHVVKTEMKGTTTINGQQQAPGMDGNVITYDVSGEGTLNIRQGARLSGAPDFAGQTPKVSAPNLPPGVNPLAPNANRPSGGLAGKFSNEKLTTEWSADGDAFKGTITMGDASFPATAKLADGKVTGEFDASGDKFPFEGSLAGDTLTFTTGGTTYTLKKAAANPLAAPVNPLAR